MSTTLSVLTQFFLTGIQRQGTSAGLENGFNFLTQEVEGLYMEKENFNVLLD